MPKHYMFLLVAKPQRPLHCRPASNSAGLGLQPLCVWDMARRFIFCHLH